MYSVKIFNEAGLTEFERLINELRNGTIKHIPEDLFTTTSLHFHLNL